MTMTAKEEFVLNNHAEILRHWFENGPEDGLNLGHGCSTQVAYLDSEKFGDNDAIIDVWVTMRLPESAKTSMGDYCLDLAQTFDLYVSAYDVHEQYLCTCNKALYFSLLEKYGFSYPIDNTVVTAVDCSIIKVSDAAKSQGYNLFTYVDVETGYVKSIVDGKTHVGQISKTWDTGESYFAYYGIEEKKPA